MAADEVKTAKCNGSDRDEFGDVGVFIHDETLESGLEPLSICLKGICVYFVTSIIQFPFKILLYYGQ